MRDAIDAIESAGDAAALVAAIEGGAEALRASDLAIEDATELGRAIARHAGHARAMVRQAVAEAARSLPDDVFEEVVTRLLRDASQYVKKAAARSYDERSRARRASRGVEERSATMRDVRARIAEEHGDAALRRADRLAELAVGQLVERLHHELVKVATPLQSAIAEVHREATRAGGDRARIAEGAERARATLDVLLGIATSVRAHARVAEPKLREENVRAMLEEQLALLRERVGASRSARMRVTVDADESLAIEVDRALLGQAIANVLQNAVEAYPEDGDESIRVEVRAEARRAGTQVAIVVEDHGRGIASESLAHVGEPFASSKGRGRGLGMLNVRKMVEAVHRGSVEIASEAGRGTRVGLVLWRRGS